MRIGIDCRYIKPGKLDGIGRFTIGIAHALAASANVELLVSDDRVLQYLPNRPVRKIRHATHPLEPFVALQVNAFNFDVVFSPMQTMGSLGKKYRLILTVHDLIYYSHGAPPRDLAWWVRLIWRLYHLAWWPQRLLLRGADAVVTVSATSKHEILSHKLTERPVAIVRNAADSLPIRSAPTAQPDDLSLVYMGSFQPYKDVETLVRGVAKIPAATLHLLSPIRDRERQRLQDIAPSARLVFHNGVSDRKYVELLDSASALVSASRAEGFGIPLIEAGRRSVPMVLTDIPIFREVAQDAALYFSPGDANSFADALVQLQHPGTWKQLSVASSDNARKYSWNASASDLLDCIHEVTLS